MLNLLLAWLVNALCLFGTAMLVPGVHITGLGSALLGALVLAVVNTLIRPLLRLLTLPITILTLGLFSFVVNAAMFGLAALLIRGFAVDGFWPALWGALLYGLLSWIANAVLLRDES